MNTFLGLLVIFFGLVISVSIIFGGPLMLVAKILGYTSPLWSSRFVIDPKRPQENPWGFFAPTDEGRVLEINTGGEAGRILWHIVFHGQYTLSYILEGVPLDQTRSDHQDVVRIPDGMEVPAVIKSGDGSLELAVYEFRKLLRKGGLDLAAFRWPWANNYLFGPRFLPLEKVVLNKDDSSTPPRRIPGATNHSRYRGDFEVVTASVPTKRDQIDFVLVGQVVYALTNPSKTRAYSSAFKIAMEFVTSSFRMWLASRTAAEAIAVGSEEKASSGKETPAIRLELEEHISRALRESKVIPTQEIGPDGAPIMVSIGEAFGWGGLRFILSDVMPATNADKAALNLLLTQPQTTIAQGEAEAKKRTALNKADIEPLQNLSPEQAARAIEMAMARSTKEVRLLRNIGSDGARLGLLAETADNTGQKAVEEEK